jgi:mycoredoxin
MNKELKITKFYGASWCADCLRSKNFLDFNGIEYTVTDIDNDLSAIDELVKLNNGFKSIPTIVFSDGSVLVEPNNKQLAEKLGL